METGITKTENTNSEVSVIKSALGMTKVRMALPYEIDSSINTAIERAIFYLGLKTPENDRTLIKATIFEDIKKHFAELTIGEIGIAIENGSKGKYGEVFGLAPKDVFNWLTQYSESQERKEVKVELEKEKDQPKQPTDEEKAQTAWNNLKSAWIFYKENGYFNDFGNSIYQTLLTNDKINFTKDQKEDFRRMATLNLQKQYNPLQHMGNVVKMNECKAIIEEMKVQGDKSTRILVEARKLALNQFFKEMVEMEVEIEDLF